MEETYRRENHGYSITVKFNAKGEASGEYTVRADNLDELKQRNSEAKMLLLQSTGKL